MSRLSNRIRSAQVSATQALTLRCSELMQQGRDIIMLNFGEPDFPTPDNIAEAGVRTIRDGNTKYTTVNGMKPLREAIVGKLRQDNGLEYCPDCITVTVGCKMALYNALMVLLDPGDEVLIPAPYWVSYPDMVRLADGLPIIVPTQEEAGFKLAPDELGGALSSRTKVLIFNSPSNPSGAVYTVDEMRALADVLRAYPNVTILTDEIYEHLTFAGLRHHSFASLGPEVFGRTVVINGMSKGYCMTGWRVGYAAGPKEIIDAMNVIHSQNVACASTISQAAAIEALGGDQSYIETNNAIFHERMQMCVAALNGLEGLRCRTTDGTFYLFANCGGVLGKRVPGGGTIQSDEDYVSSLLDAEGVAAVHGSAFGMPPYFRISFALNTQLLEEALRRVARFTESLSR